MKLTDHEASHVRFAKDGAENGLRASDHTTRKLLAIIARLTTPSPKRLVLLESPYAGDVVTNTRYARAAMRDCLLRGEAPFASHLLYTQTGVLADLVPAERALGIEAGLCIGRVMDATVVYVDLGISPGMKLGIERAEKEGRPVECRELAGWAMTMAERPTVESNV